MEAFIFWILVIGFVCSCSVAYDTVIARVRRRLQSNRGQEELVSVPGSIAADFPPKNLVLAAKDIIRGYDTPELFYQDTLVRIQLGRSIGKSPADLQ